MGQLHVQLYNLVMLNNLLQLKIGLDAYTVLVVTEAKMACFYLFITSIDLADRFIYYLLVEEN